MKVDVCNLEGNKDGEVNLPKEIFEVKFNADLVHQVAVSQMANRRQISAHTKDRSEVRGGGKKPWRQKGTGRARHGSNRSPIWRGGGITFGPRTEKVYAKEIPKKMRRNALLMVLSAKAKNKQIIVLDELKSENVKTKEIAMVLSKLPGSKDSRLIALPKYDKNIYLSGRNIEKIEIQEVRNLNALDLLNNKYLVMTKESIKTIKDTFLK